MPRTDARMIKDGDHVQSSSPQTVQFRADVLDPLSGVVHDLGNLIQVASSALNIISRSSHVETGSPLRPVIASARISLQRAGALIQQTLRLAREGNAGAEVVSMTACLMEIEALIKNTWSPDIRFDLRMPTNLPLLRCSRVSLQSAIMNLLFNARDAMPDGGSISIVAETICEDEAATGVEVRVADNGTGMSGETMRRAVEPFFTTKSSGLGGLGLPMVDHFCRNVGGRLSFESEPGAGTTVTLRLPLHVARSERQ
jgi:signal transduction histidine kinase